MQKIHIVILAGALVGALAGCGGHHDGAATPPMSSPPPPTAETFATYTQSLVTVSTCETNSPSDTNDAVFTMDANQDMEEPASTDAVTPACKST
jgi:hypothetical protein